MQGHQLASINTDHSTAQDTCSHGSFAFGQHLLLRAAQGWAFIKPSLQGLNSAHADSSKHSVCSAMPLFCYLLEIGIFPTSQIQSLSPVGPFPILSVCSLPQLPHWEAVPRTSATMHCLPGQILLTTAQGRCFLPVTTKLIE